MYDFYPEWGPARHRDEGDTTPERRTRYWQPTSAAPVASRVPAMATAGGVERRDDELQRPDDN